MKKSAFKPNNLVSKLLAINIPLVCLSVLILFSVLEARFYFNSRSELSGSLKQLVSVQDSAFASAVWEIDGDQIRSLLAEIERLPHVQSAVVTDVSGEVLAKIGNPEVEPETPDFRTEKSLVYSASKVSEVVGKLIVTVHSKHIIAELLDRAKLDILIIIVMALTLAGVTIFATRKVVGVPINRLRSSIEKMQNENIHEQVEWESTDELGQVVDAYNDMQLSQAVAEHQLKRHQDHLEELISDRTQELQSAKNVAESANEELASRVDDLADARRATLNMMADAEESRKKAEELKNSAEAATQAKSSFLAAMSHEIRTPMNGVVGMIDLLRETKLNADQSQMMATVRDSAFSLLQIINDILDFSKIEAGKLELEEIPISIRDLVQGVVDTLAPNAAKKELMIFPYIDPAIPEWVMGDQVRLRQILFNLAGNAIKFTENRDDMRGKIVIRADLAESDAKNKVAVKYSIVDNGIGISKEAQEKLFEAFTQAESSTTRKYGGTGLGLSICVKLSELMGGAIGVESELGEGSCFSTTIPHRESDKESRVTEDNDLAGLNILLITEIEEYAEFMSSYLTHWKADIEVWDERQDAVSRATEAAFNDEIYDIVILGIDFDEEEQIKVRDAFKAHSVFADSKYIFLMPYWRRGARLDVPDTVTLDALPLRRPSLLTAVAVAAGRASPETKQEEQKSEDRKVKAPTVEEAEQMGQLILVAEDNLTNQDVILRQLNLLGYAADMADNGQLALEAWQNKKYAILLTDCHMPEMDGYQLTGEIRTREDELDNRFPIIAITANALQGEADRCLEAGMDDYLSKPLEMPKLKQALKKWMPASAAGLSSDMGPLPSISEESEEAPEPEIEAAEIEETEPIELETAETNGGPIDPAALKEVFGDDDEVFMEILNEFIEPASANVKEIQDAYAGRSASDVAAAAHKLKSSSRAVGANELADLCLSLETAGKSEDWEQIDTDAPKLAGAMGVVVEYIQGL